MGKDSMKGSFLGPEFNDTDIESELLDCGAKFHKLSDKDLIERVSLDLVEGKAIGWMQGRMEFGPRSLGARSILADPRSEIMQKQLNLKVKFRESFRPFAPSILVEEVSEWFEHESDSPYMLLVADVRKDKRIRQKEEIDLFGIDKLNLPRSIVPAITHVDYSSRIQTVHSNTNPRYHSLLASFKDKTGFPLLVNTSFNVRGEPIVCSPSDAFKCFMGTGLDTLAVGNFIMLKEEQPERVTKNYHESYELD
jgi:carbamoyltransferase